MIRINLAPPEELESPYWWVPDAVVFVVMLAFGIVVVNYYLGFRAAEIAKLNEETARLEATITNLEGAVQRHKDLMASIASLEQKRNALSRITESKLVRYLPIILVEHLQNLKPEGIWFTSVRFAPVAADIPGSIPQPAPQTTPAPDGSVSSNPQLPVSMPGSRKIEVDGFAFDNVILAEFMTALKSTRNQEMDSLDVRTQVYFDSVNLAFTRAATVDRKFDTQVTKVNVVQFKLNLTFAERDAGPISDRLPPVSLDQPQRDSRRL